MITTNQRKFLRRQLTAIGAAIIVGALPPAAVRADDASKPSQPPARWVDGITLSAQIDVGVTVNPSDPTDDKNFGRLFDDKTNEVLLNHLIITAQRPIDSTSKGYDFGFKFQGMYGSDSRYTHFLHEFENVTHDLNQLDVVEANVQVHAPWFTDGGIDIKAGQYVTLEGAETIDSTTNIFYSHSYIFNFGIPFKHTGLLAVLHANPMFDLYAGIDSGVNTTLGGGDNNDEPAFHGGIGLNLLDGKLITLATTHIGPENATGALPNGLNANSQIRYLNDITTVWKATDKLTLISDLNYIHDDALNVGKAATGYGGALYGSYSLNDVFSPAIRFEVWRDEDGAFVAQSGNNVDFVRLEEGRPTLSGRTVGGGRTTYGAITFGVNIKPGLTIPHLASVVLRPEIRYDASLNDTKPFNDSKDNDMVTVAVDAVICF